MSLIEEIMNELEKERNKKTLNDVFHVTLSEETWVVTPKAGACPECKSFSQKNTMKSQSQHIPTANVKSLMKVIIMWLVYVSLIRFLII